MQQSSSILKNPLTYVLITAIWGVFYVLFGEKLPAWDGLGWDGQNYADIARDLLDSRSLNSYTATRFLPSALIHVVFTSLDISFSNANIIQGFLILNLVSVLLTTFLVMSMLQMFRLDGIHMATMFAVFFFSYCTCRFIYYYPVMTDSFSMMLSALLLYAYFRNDLILICFASILSAFTWPVTFYITLFLLLFPFKGLKVNSEALPLKNVVRFVSASIILFLLLYFIYIRGAENEIVYSLKIHRTFLPLSIIILCFTYYFLPSIFPNPKRWLGEMRDSVSWKRALLFVPLVIFMIIISGKMNPKGLVSGYMDPEYLVRTPIVLAVVRPAMFLTSHFAFFGISIALIVVFWKEVSAVIRSAGWGIMAAVALSLFWLAGTTESRSLSHLFPWMIVLTGIAIRNFKFTYLNLTILILMAFIASKIYLQIDYTNATGYNEDGTVAFPNQKFFMNQGPWMSSDMYLLHTFVLISCITAIYFIRKNILQTENEKRLYPQPTGENQ